MAACRVGHYIHVTGFLQCAVKSRGQLRSGGQREAAQTLIDAVRQSAIVAGLDMEGVGAARPDGLPPKPEGPLTAEWLDSIAAD